MKKIQTLVGKNIFDLTITMQNEAITKEDIVTVFQNNNGEYIAIIYR